MTLVSKKETVEVTAEDIKFGQPRSHCDCPVARATKRTTSSSSVVVDTIGFFVNGQPAAVTTDGVTKFMEEFDSDETRHLCRPFSFPLTYWERQP